MKKELTIVWYKTENGKDEGNLYETCELIAELDSMDSFELIVENNPKYDFYYVWNRKGYQEPWKIFIPLNYHLAK